MAFVLKDRVRESTTTAGTGAIALGGAPGGYQSFGAVMSIGDTCWYAMVLPGSAWETGIGTYSAANTLTRTTVLESSNAGGAVTFAGGTKDVLLCLPASKALAFPSGTLMLFQQTSAPLYWTKQTTHDDKALRIVSGAASFGGTNAFSTVMAQSTVGNSTLSTAQLALHNHGYTAVQVFGGNSVAVTPAATNINNAGAQNTTDTGSGNSHNHTITMSIKYVDLIIAQKD